MREQHNPLMNEATGRMETLTLSELKDEKNWEITIKKGKMDLYFITQDKEKLKYDENTKGLVKDNRLITFVDVPKSILRKLKPASERGQET